MSIFKNALTASLGLEDDAPNVQVNIDTDEAGMPLDNITEDGENTPEADEVEIIEESSEIEADDEVIEEMTEAADSLESIYIAMESAQTNGGLTAEAAQFASIAVENIVRKYGVTSSDMGISLESFNDNRVQATTVSMEGVGSALKDLWDAIVTKFHAMIKKIVDFYQKTIAAAPRIKRRAEALRKKARATTGAAKEKTIKTGLYNSLNIAGQVPTAAMLSSALKDMYTDVVTNKNRKEIVADAAALFGSFSTAGTGTTGGADGVANALKTRLGLKDFPVNSGNYTIAGSVSASGVKVGGYNATSAIEMTRNLPGNKMWFAGAVGGTERTSKIAAFRDFRCGIFTDDDTVKTDRATTKEKEWAVLATNEVESLCDLVVKNMEAIISQKTQADKKLNSVKILKKEGEKLIAKIDGDDKAKNKAEATAALQVATEVMRHQNTGEAAALSHSYRTSKAILAYCARSLSQYKKD